MKTTVTATTYERGKFTRISLNWNDAAKTLTIGKREDRFQKCSVTIRLSTSC